MNLRGLTWDHPRGYQPLEAASARFGELHGVEIGWARRSLKEFGDTPIDTLAGDFDLLVIDHPHVGIAAQCDCLVPLDSLLDQATLATLSAESAGPSFDSYRYGARQWALAVDASMQTSCFRPGLLPVQPPRDWPAVLDLAAVLRRRGRWMAVPLVPTDAVCCFLTLCAGAGGGLREDADFVAPRVGLHALRLLRTLALAAHPASLSWNPIELYEAMSGSDEIAYCPIGFCYSNYARNDYRSRRLEFADLPGGRGSLLGGAGIAVSKSCREPGVAAAFAAWLCSAEQQRGLYVDAAGQPASRSAWLDERANSLTNGFFSGTFATLRHAYVRPRDHGFVAFQEYAGRRIHDFLTTAAEGNATADATAEPAADPAAVARGESDAESDAAACFADLAEAFRDRRVSRSW
ncbi:MAG: extracellular solute-binding protein [Trueperaceae bacterium]